MGGRSQGSINSRIGLAQWGILMATTGQLMVSGLRLILISSGRKFPCLPECRLLGAYSSAARILVKGVSGVHHSLWHWEVVSMWHYFTTSFIGVSFKPTI